TVLEASRVLAARLLRDDSPEEQKVQLAFRRIVGREADALEVSLLLDYYQSQRLMHQQDKITAGKLLEVGEFPVNETVDPVEMAALMQVIQIIYNLEETITKS